MKARKFITPFGCLIFLIEIGLNMCESTEKKFCKYCSVVLLQQSFLGNSLRKKWRQHFNELHLQENSQNITHMKLSISVSFFKYVIIKGLIKIQNLETSEWAQLNAPANTFECNERAIFWRRDVIICNAGLWGWLPRQCSTVNPSESCTSPNSIVTLAYVSYRYVRYLLSPYTHYCIEWLRLPQLRKMHCERVGRSKVLK